MRLCPKIYLKDGIIFQNFKSIYEITSNVTFYENCIFRDDLKGQIVTNSLPAKQGKYYMVCIPENTAKYRKLSLLKLQKRL